MGGDGHLIWIMLGVGLNSSMDPDRDSSCKASPLTPVH